MANGSEMDSKAKEALDESCGICFEVSRISEMDSKAKEALDEWLGGDKYEVLQMWSRHYGGSKGVYYLCVKKDKALLFLRVFLLGGKWVLS